MGHRGLLRAGQGGGGIGRVRGQEVGALAQAHNPLSARTRPPDRLALERRKKGDDRCEMIPLTVPEVRRLILAMSGPHEERGFRLGWSLWCPSGRRQALP